MAPEHPGEFARLDQNEKASGKDRRCAENETSDKDGACPADPLRVCGTEHSKARTLHKAAEDQEHPASNWALPMKRDTKPDKPRRRKEREAESRNWKEENA